MVNIFIANLDWTITSEDLKTTFSSFGEVHYAHVVYEKDTKRSKGFGYVEMESAEAAISAIEALNGMEINGRAIDVKIASPKTNRPAKKEKPVQQKKPFGAKPRFSGGGSGNRPGGYQKSNYSGGSKPYNGDAPKRDYTTRTSEGEESSSSESSGEVKRVLRPRRNKND